MPFASYANVYERPYQRIQNWYKNQQAQLAQQRIAAAQRARQWQQGQQPSQTWGGPQLPQPTPLASIISAIGGQIAGLPLGAQHWNIPAVQPWQQQQQPAAPMQVSTGIPTLTPPQAPTARPTPAIRRGVSAPGFRAGFQQAAAPQLTGLLASYYPQLASLSAAQQQAQAQAGLGWAGLGQQIQQAAQQAQTGWLAQLLSALGGYL